LLSSTPSFHWALYWTSFSIKLKSYRVMV
jgi:hypothetical protein